MNAQDKAKELVNKYLSTGMMITQAKQCAIVAVDEIILVCAFHDHTKKKYFEECNSFPDYHFSTYWIEVKQQIEKL